MRVAALIAVAGRIGQLADADAGLDLADLATGFGEDRSQGLGQIGVGVLDERPRGGHHLAQVLGR